MKHPIDNQAYLACLYSIK